MRCLADSLTASEYDMHQASAQFVSIVFTMLLLLTFFVYKINCIGLLVGVGYIALVVTNAVFACH